MLSQSVMSDSFVTPQTAATRLLCPWDFPGKNTGVDCHSLLQGIFLTQGSNLHLLCLLHCRQILLPTELSGSPHFSYISEKYTGREALSHMVERQALGSVAQYNLLDYGRLWMMVYSWAVQCGSPRPHVASGHLKYT